MRPIGVMARAKWPCAAFVITRGREPCGYAAGVDWNRRARGTPWHVLCPVALGTAVMYIPGAFANRVDGWLLGGGAVEVSRLRVVALRADSVNAADR